MGDQPEYISHEEFVRRRALRLIKRNPPPTRDPDTIHLPSADLSAAEVEVTAPGTEPIEQRQRVVVRLRSGSNYANRLAHERTAQESNETAYLAVALVSFFVPGGFLLAIWPAVASRGGARILGIICICIHLALVILVLAALRGGYE